MQFEVVKPKLDDGEERVLTQEEWHYELQQRGMTKDVMKCCIIIDCGSTMKATICNPDFLTNIRKTTSPTIMKTNAGHRNIEFEGDMDGFGTCHFDPNFIANILVLITWWIDTELLSIPTRRECSTCTPRMALFDLNVYRIDCMDSFRMKNS